MADNVQLNSGTGGDVAAADDIGGVKYQRVKLALGADGSFDGDVSASLPMPVVQAGVATSANQATEIASLASIDSKLSGALNVTGSTVGIVGNVEVTNDVGNPLPVSGTVTANAGTNLNTSALALEAGHLASIDAKDFATQTTLALIKTDVDKIPADPAREGGNLATLTTKDFATQTTLALVKAKTDNIPAQGAAVTAASLPVNIASDQVVPVSAAALPLPSGAATETTLVALSAKIPAQGQAQMIASLPVVIAIDQDSIGDRYARRLAEKSMLEQSEAGQYIFIRHAYERTTVPDRRGCLERGTVR